MVIKYRGDLTKLFNTNVVHDAKNYESLINSVLVKRDDQFYGKWQPGIGYKTGDVVLHNHTFYYFKKKENTTAEDDCKCDDCGNEAPTKDSCCWKQVRFDVNDHDWEFIEAQTDPKQKVGLFAAVTGRVGIGTGKDAAAFFHINDNKKGVGQHLFNPLETDCTHFPMLKMVDLSMPQKDDAPLVSSFVAQSLDEKKVIYATNTKGYLFRQVDVVLASSPDVEKTDAEIPQQEASQQQLTLPIPAEKPLLYITSVDQKPRVGIGTDKPKTTLDVNLDGHGQIRLDAGEDNVPDITLVNKSTWRQETYLTEAIDARQAALVTNASHGFVLKSDKSYAERFEKCGDERMQSGKTLMVVQPDETMRVKVGIGTSKPATQVEVEGNEGKIQMSLDDKNPSLNIINTIERNEHPVDTNFLALGAMGANTEQQAVLSTNSQDGFVFSHLTRQDGGVPSVNRGTKFLFLKRDKSSNDAYSMIMDGRVAAKGFYAAAAPNNAAYLGKNKALSLINEFKPMLFNSPDRVEEEQYGFLSSEMPNTLDGFVKDFDGLGKDDKAIAYHSIVALLVGAVKDLTATVNKMQGKINELENRGKHK